MKRPSFFFDADTGASTGAAPGSSGAAALTAEISPTGDADGIDPLSYVPPSTDDLEKFIKGDEGDDAKGPLGKEGEPPAKPDPKAPVKKDPEPKVDPKPEPKPDDTAPASQLRGRLKQLEEEKTRLETELAGARSDKRVEELTARLAEKETAIAAKEKAVADAERKLMVHNPLVSKRLGEMSEAFNKDFASVSEMIPALQPNYRALVDEFEAMPRGKPEFAQAIKDFRERLRETYEHDANTVFEQVRKGVEFRRKYAETADEVQRDAESMIFEETKKQWQENTGKVEKQYDDWFKPPADAEANDPYNHNLFLQNFEKAMPPEEVKRINGNIKAYVARVFNGPQPRTKADFPGMDDAAIQKAMGEIDSKSKAERDDAARIMAIGVKLITYFRPLIAEWQKNKARAGERTEAAPPDPTRKDGTRPAANEEDVLNLEMPSPEDIAAAVGAR